MNGDETPDPIAVVAGVSLGSYQRSDWRPVRSGWVIRVLPSQQLRHGNLKEIWKRVLNVGDERLHRTDAGVHFLLAHDREDERPLFRRELRRRSLRAVWLDRQLSTRYGSSDFRRAIDSLLEFEEAWRQRLRPHLNSPLLLPESAFETRANVRDTWGRVHDVVVGHDDIGAVREAVQRFVREHRKGSGWTDTRRLRFSRGTPHGQHGLSSWRRQKLGFSLPSGFHFDVRHEQRRGFQLIDQDGTRREFNVYTNVDPHGYLRGGR